LFYEVSRKRFCSLFFQDANECDDEIKALRDHQIDLSKSLEEKQVNVQQLQGTSDTLDRDVESMIEMKQKVQKTV
jgi:hypothetical protein